MPIDEARSKDAGLIHWADQVADQIIQSRGDKDTYVCASGITPSGTVHIGNFREIMTTDLVAKALKDRGKNVRFIYIWDDYDRFRKVPKNLPGQERLKKFIGYPVASVPDPYGCHDSYARHFETETEESIQPLDLDVEFLYQNKNYKDCIYAESIRKALISKERIRKILDKFRKEPLPDDWYPLSVYCEICGTDDTKVEDYDGKYSITYSCRCGHKNTIDFRKLGIVKLSWRVDWPMRWDYYDVDFEPGGKDHSSVGGSRDTAKIIIKHIFDSNPPVYKMYDFLSLKGLTGKMSGSEGNTVSVKDVLEVYTPEVMRFMFAGTKPNKEFAFAFDDEIFKIYEDFYKTERSYFNSDEPNEKKLAQLRRVYRLSVPGVVPKRQPVQPAFRTVCDLLQGTQDPGRTKQILLKDFEEPMVYDMMRVDMMIVCADNWLKVYAPDQYRIEVNKNVPKKVAGSLSEGQVKALKSVASSLAEKDHDEDELFDIFKDAANKNDVKMKDFFKGFYLAIIGKERGPRLAGFIKAIGEKKVAGILGSL